MTLLNSQRNISTTLQEKWEKYIHDLYNDERHDQQGIESAVEGPGILRNEVEYVRCTDEIHGGVVKISWMPWKSESC